MSRDDILAMEPGVEMDMLVELELFDKAASMYYQPRPFSTDISAAMEVAHFVKDKAEAHIEIELFFDSRIDGRVTITDIPDREDIMIPYGEKQNAGFPKTLTEAICKAALLAVMEE